VQGGGRRLSQSTFSKDKTRILDTFLKRYILWGRLTIFCLISLAQRKQFEHPRYLSILSPRLISIATVCSTTVYFDTASYIYIFCHLWWNRDKHPPLKFFLSMSFLSHLHIVNLSWRRWRSQSKFFFFVEISGISTIKQWTSDLRDNRNEEKYIVAIVTISKVCFIRLYFFYDIILSDL
jgi:hypothetical protein